MAEDTQVGDQVSATIVPVGQAANVTTTASIENGATQTQNPLDGGRAEVQGASSVVLDKRLILKDAQSPVSRLHTLVHNMFGTDDPAIAEIKSLLGELGDLFARL